MKTPDLISAFRFAAWQNPVEMQRFAREVGSIPAGDLEKLLEAMSVAEWQAEARLQEVRRAALETVIIAAANKDLGRVLLKAAPTASEDVRKVMVRVLPRLHDPARLEDTLALLRDRAPSLRRLGAEVLQAVGGFPVQAALTEALKEPNFPGRREALDVLVAMGGGIRALVSAMGVLQVGDSADKIHALKHLSDPRLASLKLPDVLAGVRACFADVSDDVVVQAIRTFTVLCGEDDFFSGVVPGLQSPRLPVVKAVVDALRRFPVARAMDALEWRFKAGPTLIRLAILDTLELLQNERVVPLLAEALANPHLTVRRRASAALVRLGAANRIDLRRTILWLMRNPDVNVRRMAVEMAQGVADPADELWPELLAFLGDVDWWVRGRLVDALCALAGKKLLLRLPPLLPAAPPLMRLYAVELFERLGDPEAIPSLAGVIQQDPDALVRERAVEALGRINTPLAEQALIAVLREKPELQLVALDAVTELGARGASTDVALLLSSGDPDVRLAALECLDALDDVAQQRFVEAVFDDPNLAVRKRAQAILERWRTYGTASIEVREDSNLDALLSRALSVEADALLLGGGARPLFRRLGRTDTLVDVVIPPEQLNRMIMPLLSAQQHQHFHALEEVDLSYEFKGLGRRFRAHVFPQRNGVTAVFQLGRQTMQQLEGLGLPEQVKEFTEYEGGLILVGGGPQSGKSTTVHALIDRINRNSSRHIITLEQSLEVVHQPVLSAVTQREIGRHARDLPAALKASLREDPDVIVIDDLKDFGAISFALTAAETGHLVMGVLQTTGAQAALERIIKAFPPQQHEAVQGMVAASLRAVMVQRLYPRADGQGRVAVCEVMFNNGAAQNLIRKGKTLQLGTLVATSADAGMVTFDADLQRRMKEGTVAPPDAARS